jgi:hypothetical protein
MNNQKIKETLDMGSFLKELAEEGNVKFGFAIFLKFKGLSV